MNLAYKIIYLVVIFSIILSLWGTSYELSGGNLPDHPFFGILLSPFDNVRYGHLIVRKLFLVVIAFLVLGYFLKSQKINVLATIKQNFKYIVIIGLVLVLSRILTYGFWFYNDDTRFFHYHLFAPTQPDYSPQSTWFRNINLQPFAI